MDGEAKSCTFRWKIQNISQCWWLMKEVGIYSPAFTANELKSSKWSLCFIPYGRETIKFALKREKDCGAPDTRFKIRVLIECLDICGAKIFEGQRSIIEFKKNTIFLFDTSIKSDRVFDAEREFFTSEDTLIVECTMWVEKEKLVTTNCISATTSIKVDRRSFLWQIHKPDALESERITNEYKDELIDFQFVFYKGFERLMMRTASFHDNVKYISCETSAIDSEGKKESCGIFIFPFDASKMTAVGTYFELPDILKENKSLYFPQDILSFESEFVISTVQHIVCIVCNTLKVKLKFPEGDEKDEDDEEDEDNDDEDTDEKDDQEGDRVEKAIRCSRPRQNKRLFPALRLRYSTVDDS